MAVYDAAVVGGGVVGCAVAFELARAGASVALIERDEVAAHASGAAAGMLAPIAESSADSALFRLGMRSLGLFPDLVRELADLSGIDAELVQAGILRVATAEEAPELRRRARELAEYDCEWCGVDELRKREPRLSEEFVGGLWSPREACLDPLLLTRAYAGAAQRRGAELHLGASAVGLLHDHGRVQGVRTAEGRILAGDVVLCTGAWSRLVGDWIQAAWPVEPVKGQMLALEAPRPPLTSIVWSRDAYIVPRPDGSVRVGATVERVGFDARPTARGLSELLGGACATLPALGSSRFVSAWAGVRPSSPDGLPLLGPVASWAGLWLATGHHRNGILLSAVTSRLIAQGVLEGHWSADYEVFEPSRFAPRV